MNDKKQVKTQEEWLKRRRKSKLYSAKKGGAGIAARLRLEKRPITLPTPPWEERQT